MNKKTIFIITLCFGWLLSCEKKDYYQPLLDIISPINGETVRDTVLINIKTTDEGGIAHVDFYIDGSLYFSDSVSLYQYYWDTKKHENGEHFIKIISNDESGNLTEEHISVTIQNLPGDYYPDKIEMFDVWDMEIEFPYIYVALNKEGLWRKNYIIENDWEYLGFTDTTGKAGATSVSIYDKDIIVTSRNEHFWHSLDSGETWVNTYLSNRQQENDKLNVIKVQRSYDKPNILIAIEGSTSFYKSIDGGVTWDHIYRDDLMSFWYRNIIWHPIKPEEVWSFGGGPMEYGKLICWNEYGASLKTYVDFNSSLVRVFDMAFDSADENTIYFLGDHSVYKSIDGGLNWQSVDLNNFYFKTRSILGDPRAPNSFFSVTLDNGIYYTKDGFKHNERIQLINGKIRHVLIKDNLLFYQSGGDIKYISLNKLKPL